jgi:hypothetical protein
MSLAAMFREIQARTGICVPTLMNRYHNQGLRGVALEAPIGSLRPGRNRSTTMHVAWSALGSSAWPPCTSRHDDALISRLLVRWPRVDPSIQPPAAPSP